MAMKLGGLKVVAVIISIALPIVIALLALLWMVYEKHPKAWNYGFIFLIIGLLIEYPYLKLYMKILNKYHQQQKLSNKD